MISTSNIDVVDALRQFKSVGIAVAFIVPTRTGMQKSIMDATIDVRGYLNTVGVHDFSKQIQGPENKKLVPTKLVSKDVIIETQTSLYRPNTKNGDPRIWIYRLAEVAEPSDLIALIGVGEELVIVNCSKTNLNIALSPTNAMFRDILSHSIPEPSDVASELLSKIQHISEMGYVTTLRPGDTGVGFTLETLLEIPANSSTAPDYKGIELKSGRISSHRSGRSTIFSKVPNWKISRLKSSRELLYTRGKYKEDKQRVQLFHELSVVKANSYDLQLELDPANDSLHQIYVGDESLVKDVTWEIETLKKSLVKKHKETFWITAQTQGHNGDPNEAFWYTDIKHTGGVDPNAFSILLELGVVTLDYTIKEKSKGVAKDQGYLFKMSSRDLDLLFTRVDKFDLRHHLED